MNVCHKPSEKGIGMCRPGDAPPLDDDRGFLLAPASAAEEHHVMGNR